MRLNWVWPTAQGNGMDVLWRVLGAVLLGVLLARWSWILFAPHPGAAVTVSERGAALEAARLFGVATSAAPAAISSASEVLALPNVQLLGVFAASKASFAVLNLEGKQVGVALGENLVSGMKLAEVHADHVLLERAGVKYRVNLESGVAGASGAMAAPVTKGALPVER